MRRNEQRPVRSSLAAAGVTLVLLAVAGCGAPSERDVAAAARQNLIDNDAKAAVVRLKSGLQSHPQSGELRFLLGEALARSGDAAGSVVELEKALDLKYPAVQVAPRMAQSLLATGKAKAVVQTYADTSFDNPKATASLKATVAAAQLVMGQADKARGSVEAALALDPKNTAARLLDVRLTASRGAHDEALALLDALLKDEPAVAKAWALRGDVLWIGKRDADSATEAYSRALSLDAREVSAHEALIRIAMLKNDVPVYRARVEALQKALPQSFEARFHATQLALFDKDLKRAQEGAAKLLQQAPRSPAVLQLAGVIAMRTGAHAQAQTHFGKLMQELPDQARPRVQLAEAQLRAGQPGSVVTTLKPLIDGDSRHATALGLAARAEMEMGNLDAAELYYTRAAKANPADPQPQVALALARLQKGDIDTGLARLEAVAEADSGTYADLALVAALMRANRLEPALAAVDRLQRKAKNDALPHFLQGQIELRRRNPAAARSSWDKALVADPGYYPAIEALASLDVAEKKPDDARKRFDAVVAREPANVRARLGLVELREKAGAKPEEIEKLLVDVVKANPSEELPRVKLVAHHLERRQAKAAVLAAQDGVAALPNSAEMLASLGNAQLAAGEHAQALRTFEKVPALQPRAPLPYLRLAELHAAGGDIRAAIQDVQRALDVAPQYGPAQSRLVQLLVRNKQQAEALAYAKRVQQQRPGDPAGQLLEADVHLAQKAWGPGAAALQAALKRERSTETAKRLHALYVLAGRPAEAQRFADEWMHENPTDTAFLFHLGSVETEAKNYAAAETAYRRILATQPDWPQLLNNLAWTMIKQGKPGGLALADRANKISPDVPAFMDTLAASYLAEGSADKALEWQRKVVAQAPGESNYRLNLARILIAKGAKSEAKAELDKLAKLGSSFRDQPEVASLLRTL